MKALKVIGVIVALILAAILIVPLFSPATVEVESNIEIALEPAQIFPSVASFEGRESWDPWLTNDSTASAEIESLPGFVGSTYTWSGVAVGTGKMEVISVKENEYIESHLWFGDVEEPALVEWEFEQVDGGCNVVWSFAQETVYPFGRLGMMIGKGFLKKAFDLGLANLKEVMEANPPVLYSTGPISVTVQEAFSAMVAKERGNMSDIPGTLEGIFGMVMAEVAAQNLEVAGPPFANYLDYDAESGDMTIVAGIKVVKAGKLSGDVVPVVYNEMKVLTAVHTGNYESLHYSYERLKQFAEEKSLELNGEAFEFYLNDPGMEKDPAKWLTSLAFPIL